jgi:hypothetical protein
MHNSLAMLKQKARKRMAMLIRVVDQTGFLHCINVTTALITLQSVPV